MASGFLDGLTSFMGTSSFYIKWASTRLLRPVYHILPPGNSAARATLQKLSSFLTKRGEPSILHDFPCRVVKCFHLYPERNFLTLSGRRAKIISLSTKCKCVDGDKTMFLLRAESRRVVQGGCRELRILAPERQS